VDLINVVGVVIAPAIGIARLGNSPDEYFLGPEVPGHAPNPTGGFKDKLGRVKRQGARFRIYGIDVKGVALCEITADEAEIEWSVHLANTKASWFEFHGRFGPTAIPRNKFETDRTSLNIDPGLRRITGREKHGSTYQFESGAFRGKKVPLGEVRTDEAGRLIVLGGFGHSACVPEGGLITNYANNNGWHDDISDGPVTAKVRLKDGRNLEPAASRVLCVPPKFTPEMENIVTLYEVLEFTWFGEDAIPKSISFTRDVYPILKRIASYPWVNALAYRGHSAGKGGDFLGEKQLAVLSSNTVINQKAREGVFRRIRNPKLDFKSPEAVAEASYAFMPALAGDNNGPKDGDPTQWLRLRPSQYAILQLWSQGKFEADWQGTLATLPSLNDLPVAERPSTLTRAALQPCVGGAFYPGIEMTYVAEDKALFTEPFRLRSDIPPGGITQYMACPWQADFYECNTAWWPVARPDDVVSEEEYIRVVLGESNPDIASLNPPAEGWSVDSHELFADRLAFRESWDRGLIEYPAIAAPGNEGDAAMVELWSHLGFVVSRLTSTQERVFVETERDPFVGIDYRTFYFYLCNIDDYPEFLPKVKQIAHMFLKRAWEMQKSPNFPDTDRFFDYSEQAFEARLGQIYTELVEANNSYDPATDPIFKTRESVLYRILQMAPFNQNDGAWIHSITPAGPLDAVDNLLFNIWMDEVGNGSVGYSHCNLYTDLLREVGITLTDPRSRDYAQDPRFLDSAFTVPLMELALSQFSQTFYPELLGFTLQLEWTVVSLKPTIKLLEYFGINPHFYKLHVGIDNAASGHGAKAKQAIKIYLDNIRHRGGDEAMQQAWKRIWMGFIAFDQTGSLFQDMAAHLAAPVDLGDQVAKIIAVKKPVASQNHGDRKLGANYINDWFEDPPGFMQALVDGGYFVKGHADQSSFFKLIGFNGPMFKVFTSDELDTLRAWVNEDCPMPGQVSPVAPIDPGVLMAETVETLQLLQVNAAVHDNHTLKGRDITGQAVNWSISTWFRQVSEKGPSAVLAFMEALSDQENGWIQKGEPDGSPFVTKLLAPSGAMGAAFEEIAPNSGGLTRRQVVIAWIQKKCKIPMLNTQLGQRYFMASLPNTAVYPRGRIRGNGAAH
jgi:hypothetical protein